MKTLDPPTSSAWPGLKESATKRTMRHRVPTGIVVAVVAALAAFVLVAAATKDRSATTQIAVAAHEIQAGKTVAFSDVRLVELPRSSPLRPDLVNATTMSGGKWVAGQRLAAGTPIPRSALLATAAPSGLRAMSLAVAPEHAAGGDIRPGDRVDIIDVGAGEATHVARSVEVLSVANPEGGGIVRSGPADYFVVVAVDESTSLRLAEALADGKIDVVRATGAGGGWIATLVVGVAATPRPWRQDLATYARDHVADLVVRTIRDPERLFDEHLHAVMVDDVSTLLTRPWLARARAAGLRLVGVFDPTGTSGRGEHYLRELGVERTIPATATPEEMVTALLQLADTLDDDRLAADLAARAGLRDDPAAPQGTITAVGGPGGAGSTEVALCLADRLHARGRSTVLLEANEGKPCLVRRLGLASSPHLLDALRAAHHGEPPIAECFAAREFEAGRPVTFAVITGIPRPSDWHLVRRSDVVELLDALRAGFDEVVVDIAGHCDELGHGMPERWAASRAALRAADRLIGVCPANGPAGVTAFLDWLAEVGALRPPPALVAVNPVPRALATWYLQAKRDGREAGHLTPLLAGLAELVPWLRQWYDEPDADPALDRPGTQIAALVDAELRALHLTAEQLTAWRPLPARRGGGRARA